MLPDDVRASTLLSGERSAGNLRLDRRLAYREIHRTSAGPYDLVHLFKARMAAQQLHRMNSLECPWRLVVCDMDGTLVRGTTALAHLGARLGHGAAIEDVETQLARGEVSDRDVAEAYAGLYRGITLADAVAAMSTIARIDDVAAGVELLRQRSVEVLIATVSWSFAAGGLADLWGFSGVCGADLEVDQASGTFTGRVLRHVAPGDKVAFVAEHCRRTGIPMQQVVAIGDSRSDLPLFAAVGYSVALNATSDARVAARATADGSSFLTALRAVPGLVEPKPDVAPSTPCSSSSG